MLLDDPARCIHVGDRESDIYELSALPRSLALTSSSGVASIDWQATVSTRSLMRWPRSRSRACIELRSATTRAVWVLRMWSFNSAASACSRRSGKQKRYPALSLTVIHARERDAPAHRPAIDWKLITDLPVTTCAEAVEKLHCICRFAWKIEVFLFILKAGCRAEVARLRTAERFAKLIAEISILRPKRARRRARRASRPLAHPARRRFAGREIADAAVLAEGLP